jgi:hypothetical protein
MTTKSTVLFSEFDNSKLLFTELEDNQRTKGQKLAYPRYVDEHANTPPIQLPWITMDTMGIPSICEYYPDDSKRDFVKVPLNQTDQEIKQFTEHFQELDELLGSQEMRGKIFGDKASKYEYQSIIRAIEEQENKKESKYKRPSYPFYMKFKLDTEYGTGKLKTKIFLSEMKEGKRVRTEVQVNSIDELSKQFWLNKIRPVVRMCKLWAQPPNKKGASYGVTFKLIRVEVEPSKRVQRVEQSDEFLDSDEESEVVQKVVQQKVVKDVESDDEVKTPVKTKVQVEPSAPLKPPTKVVKMVDSDEESDDDEPVVQTKKQPVKVVDSDEESDDDEPVVQSKKPVKGSKFTTTKSKKASA